MNQIKTILIIISLMALILFSGCNTENNLSFQNYCENHNFSQSVIKYGWENTFYCFNNENDVTEIEYIKIQIWKTTNK